MTAKCKLHLNKAAKKSNERLKKQKVKELSPATIRREEKRAALDSKLRMRNFREERKRAILGMKNLSARRIATSLNSIRDNKKYVIVPNAVPASLNLSDIVLKGAKEPITFTDPEPPHTRSIQALNNPELVLSDILEAVKVVFRECKYIVAKMLVSKPGDKEQITHLDFVQDDFAIIRTLSHFHFSAIISLEEGTELLVGKSRIPVSIPLHSMLFFRGDMPHAGAGYPLGNSRLFLSASSDTFPVTDDVYLVKDTDSLI